MRRRTNLDSSDSLELLHDTICNVFGGIIFIAILLSMLTSGKTAQVKSDTRAQRNTIAAISEASTVQAQILSLESALAELERMRQTIATSKTSSQHSASQLMNERQQQAQQRVDRAKQWIAHYEKNTVAGVSDLDAKHAKAKVEVEQLEITAGEVRESRVIKGRLPMERKTTRDQIIAILWRDRAYLAPGSAITGAGGDTGDVNVARFLMVWNVTPMPGRGIPLGPDIARQPDFINLAARHNPNREFIDFFVFPESVPAFTRFRDALADRGFSYNVHPMPTSPNGSVRFQAVDSVNVQ